MTDVTQDRDQDGAELSAADEQVLRELGPRRQAAAHPAGVSGLRYLPSLQNLLPDTTIFPSDTTIFRYGTDRHGERTDSRPYQADLCADQSWCC
jgi:hypothetical protein